MYPLYSLSSSGERVRACPVFDARIRRK